MRLNLRLSFFCLLMVVLSCSAQALTVGQVQGICAEYDTSCRDNPFLQAYVGGGLDMLATLKEQGTLTGIQLCEPSDELFDVDKILDFLSSAKDDAKAKNAMHQVISYLQREGSC
ncbi:hypothetical protein [Arenicella xantha]|uniref:Rap1a immunity protein domain-containing protein n=1 Tax=Arenicella xantha TaxID=644221 RepID=A0A395JSR0_9GAMM|nr:hypothetical protein [Arenicella xantha]RBP51740.1 hypothetical protein DFR28_1021173 [Arenicella xantha]